MSTKFMIVAHYQTHENYAAHDENYDPLTHHDYWKPKGNHEQVVATGITLDTVMAIGSEGLLELVLAAEPESDNYFSYSNMDWELIEINDALIKEVRDQLHSVEYPDIPYMRYAFKSEAAWDWAIAHIPESDRNLPVRNVS